MNRDRWFPLVPRKRPPAEPIGTRVERVLRDAQLTHEGDGQARLLGGDGQRLFDGRPVTVLARLADGEVKQALTCMN